MDNKTRQIIVGAIYNINDLNEDELLVLSDLGPIITPLLKTIYPQYKPLRTSDVMKRYLLNPSVTQKPIQYTKEGRALYNYTNPHTTAYDAGFSELIKKRKPDWFKSKVDTDREEFNRILNERAQAAADAYMSGDHLKTQQNINPTPMYNGDIDINDDDPDLAHPMFDVFRNK